MSANIIYISRRCNNCQELLILIHKNTELRNLFKITDIDTNPYPQYLKVVPTMVVNDSIILGEELFKYINILIDKLNKRVTPPLENSTKPIPSELEPNKTEEPEESGELDGFCLDGNCALPFSSLEDDEYIDNKQFFEELEQIEENKTEENLPTDTTEKHNEVSNAYEEMMKERQRQEHG
jgi:hypothetical protein